MAARVVVIADDGTQIEISDPDPETGMIRWDCPDGTTELWHVSMTNAIECAQIHADYGHGKV